MEPINGPIPHPAPPPHLAKLSTVNSPTVPARLTLDTLPPSARRVYLELLRYGPLPRTQLAERLGLSAASLTRVTAPLVDAKLMLQGAPVPSEVGRPAIPLSVNLTSFALIGLSITHESLVAIATDARATVLDSRTLSLTDLRPNTVLREAGTLIAQLRASLAASHPALPVAAIGVNIGAQIDGGRIVREAPFLEWTNVRAADRLEELTGLPVLIVHDLTSLAEAENWFGAGLEASRFIVVTVGIGTGFALVMDGRVITDENTGFGTITDAIRGPDWPDLSGASPLSAEESARAARKVGRLVGTAAAFTMPQAVVISGEGARFLAGNEEELDASIAEVRHVSASGLDIQLREHDFAFWARGAATAAIQWILGVGEVAAR